MSFRPGAKPPRQLMKTLDGDEQRQEVTIELRKSKREESVRKRRHATPNADANATTPTLLQQKLHQIPHLVTMIQSGQELLQIEAAAQFRKLLSIERNPPIQQVIDSGVIRKLVDLLKYSNSPVLQFESAWALTTIASGTSKHTRAVIDMGAIPVFVNLLKSPNDDVKEEAVWALGNIAGDSAGCRDQVLAAGALPPLLQLLQLCTANAKITMLRIATWSLSNLCRGRPQPDFTLVEPALPVLAKLLCVLDDEVLTDACWAISYLSDDAGPPNQKIQAVIQAGVARRLVELLMHQSSNVKTPALHAVGNIVTGDDVQTQVIMNCNALQCLLALLVNPKKSIRKEACWAISNITAGNPEQIEWVINANIIPPLVSILKNEEFDIQKEAAWAISNATSGGTDAQIRYLANQGVIQPLCELFTCPDSNIIMVAMEGIENILRVGKNDAQNDPQNDPQNVNVYADMVDQCKGLDYLDALQQRHENEDIYQKIVSILQIYFVSDDGNENADVPAPQATSDGTQFHFSSQQSDLVSLQNGRPLEQYMDQHQRTSSISAFVISESTGHVVTMMMRGKLFRDGLKIILNYLSSEDAKISRPWLLNHSWYQLVTTLSCWNWKLQVVNSEEGRRLLAATSSSKLRFNCTRLVLRGWRNLDLLPTVVKSLPWLQQLAIATSQDFTKGPFLQHLLEMKQLHTLHLMQHFLPNGKVMQQFPLLRSLWIDIHSTPVIITTLIFMVMPSKLCVILYQTIHST